MGFHRLPCVVARLTEVVSAKTEPSSGFATVAAFVNNVISAVLSTVFHSNLDAILLAEAANKIFRLNFRLLFHLVSFLVTFLDFFVISVFVLDICSAVTHSTVVWQLALKAFVVSELKQSKLFKFVIKLLALLGNSLAFIKSLNPCSVNAAILYHFIHPCSFFNYNIGISGKILFLSHLLIAGRAINVVAVNGFSGVPLSLNFFTDAIRMEDMLAF